MIKIFNVILILGIVGIIYFIIQNNNSSDYIYPTQTKNIEFIYDMPQENIFQNTWYPNKWIEKIDKNGNPIYNSRKNIYIPNPTNINHMENDYDPKLDIQNSLWNIYDKSITDYKKLIPNKKYISNQKEYVDGASNLVFYKNTSWDYEDEKPENGGEISNGLYGVDPSTIGSVAIY